MIGAALDTRRRALGLSVAETAEWLGLPEERTLNRWINGEKPPTRQSPAELLMRLDDLEELMEAFTDQVIREAERPGAQRPFALERFATGKARLIARSAKIPRPDLPVGAHAVAVAWADDQLAARGIDTVIEWVV